MCVCPLPIYRPVGRQLDARCTGGAGCPTRLCCGQQKCAACCAAAAAAAAAHGWSWQDVRILCVCGQACVGSTSRPTAWCVRPCQASVGYPMLTQRVSSMHHVSAKGLIAARTPFPCKRALGLCTVGSGRCLIPSPTPPEVPKRYIKKCRGAHATRKLQRNILNLFGAYIYAP